MRPTRTSQPYRKLAGRVPGPALTAMKRGRSASGINSADVNRAAAKLAAAGKRQRAKRPPRVPRPPR